MLFALESVSGKLSKEHILVCCYTIWYLKHGICKYIRILSLYTCTLVIWIKYVIVMNTCMVTRILVLYFMMSQSKIRPKEIQINTKWIPKRLLVPKKLKSVYFIQFHRRFQNTRRPMQKMGIVTRLPLYNCFLKRYKLVLI